MYDFTFDIKQHNTQCYAGIARTAIKTGDTHRGVNIANELTEPGLIIELAGVCESSKQFNDAAKLYEKGNLIEKAATLYIQTGNFQDAD